jgi:ankyrin repeat protein
MFATVAVVGQIGRSALLVACAAGHVDVARWLLASVGCDAKLERDKVRLTMAFPARVWVIVQHVNGFQCECDGGRVVVVQEQCTALLCACMAGKADVVRMLVSSGASDARSERDQV